MEILEPNKNSGTNWKYWNQIKILQTEQMLDQIKIVETNKNIETK